MGGIQVGERPPSDAELLYNYATVGTFYCGIAFYLAHAVLLAQRGVHWLVLKMALLAFGWAALLSAAAAWM